MQSHPQLRQDDAITETVASDDATSALLEEIEAMTVNPGVTSGDVVADDVMAALDLLDDLPVEDRDEPAIEEDIVEEPDETALEAQTADDAQIEDLVDEDIDRAVEIEIAKSEAYESAEGSDMTTEATPVETKPAKTKASKGTGVPRVARDLSSLPAENFVLTTEIPEDLDANKAAVLASRPAIKKVAEKFDNVLAAVAAGRKPSVYVMECFEVLAKTGETTSTDLVAALRKKYSEGTARSQAGQIMALFPILKIADREKQTLKLRADSMLAQALKDLMGKSEE